MNKMGEISSKYQLRKSIIKDIRKELNLKSNKSTKKWYGSFMKSYPTGQVDEAEFVSIYKKFFPQGEVQDFARHVFRAFGGKEKGSIGFKEFYKAFVLQTSGDLNEKIVFAFRMYDLDGDGEITKDEMLTIIQSIYKLLGPNIRMPSHLNTPEKRTEHVFNQMDVNKVGNINFAEFLAGALNNSFILRMLGGSLDSSPTSSKKSIN
ncbi:Neurocalcin-like [Oopsacas minuta]|uniref:Neurocalcin-like n=1 Tax=Oopsacas minuta TaxID=111878 RepID=A0AAV7KF67_9METZ|nr:Neurocalcin-like [Oopsacas minuta]